MKILFHLAQYCGKTYYWSWNQYIETCSMPQKTCGEIHFALNIWFWIKADKNITYMTAAVVTCANLLPDSIIIIHFRPARIFARFRLWSRKHFVTWWRHQIETFSTLLALCEGNPSVNDGFPSHIPMTWSFDVFFDLCLNKRLSKRSRRRWFETPSLWLWRHSNKGLDACFGELEYHWFMNSVSPDRCLAFTRTTAD